MSDFAYHMEALRKARIIERKNAAQTSSGPSQHLMEQYNPVRSSANPQRYMTQGDSHRMPSWSAVREYKDPVFEMDDHMDYPAMHWSAKHALDNYMGDTDFFRTIEVRQGTGYDRIVLPASARHSSACVQSGIYKDLKRQEKTLRDHNLVMGPMTAFKDYFDTNNYNPHKSELTHY